MGFDEASAAEPFACAINAQELLGIDEGDTVVVFRRRADRVHPHADRARRSQGRAVFLVDVNAERLAMSAAAVQPDEVIDASKVDVVAEVMRLTGGGARTW